MSLFDQVFNLLLRMQQYFTSYEFSHKNFGIVFLNLSLFLNNAFSFVKRKEHTFKFNSFEPIKTNPQNQKLSAQEGEGG